MSSSKHEQYMMDNKRDHANPAASRIPRPASRLLIVLGLGAALVYAAALWRFPLLTIYAQPLQNLDKLTRSDWRVGLVLAGCILLLFLGYALGARLVRRTPRPPYLALLAFPLIFVAILLFVYPTTSIDLYDYLFRGRMLAHYGANTFVSVPQDFSGDPLFGYLAWRRAVSAYGPIWEQMSWLTARLAGDAPTATLPNAVILLRLMFGYKLLATLGFLLCGAAIWWALGRSAPEQRALGLYLWLWNPLALWELVAAGHNDAWMALLIVVAVALLAATQGDRRQETGDRRDEATSSARLPISQSPSLLVFLSFLALTLGGLIKYLALIFAPLLLAAALRRRDGWRARVRLVLIGGAACAALVVGSYAPFWVGAATLRQFSDRGTLFTASWLAALQALLAQWAAKETVQPLVAAGSLALLLLGVLWATWRAWQRPDAVAEHALWLLLWFLFFSNPWFQPWYLLWALALVALQPQRQRVVALTTVFCSTALLSYLPGVFLLPLLADPKSGWNESAAWNALLTLLIYVPPLLALGWRRWPRRGARRAQQWPLRFGRRPGSTLTPERQSDH